MEVDEQLSAISDNEIEEETSPKKQAKSLWNDEAINKQMQRITAADFEETRDLSDTDDEFDPNSLKVAESDYGIKMLDARKYYAKSTDKNQMSTYELVQIQKQFEEKVLHHIAKDKKKQPKSDPPEPPAFHTNCSCGHGKAEVFSSDSESSSNSSSSSSSESDEEGKVKDDIKMELDDEDDREGPKKYTDKKKQKRKKGPKKANENEHSIIAREEVN
uniref:Uncharacterized protein n=1 Tax=Acrobeloides nanus TaxID=290746 RepID=A0A914D3H1_9BILA